MTSTKELLVEYNKIAPKPLKVWKGSQGALQKKLDALTVKLASKAIIGRKGKGTTKKAPDLSNSSVVDPVPKTGDLKIRTAAEWARHLKKNPKVVRAKLRKAGLSTRDGWDTIVEGSEAYKVIASIRGTKK